MVYSAVLRERWIVVTDMGNGRIVIQECDVATDSTDRGSWPECSGLVWHIIRKGVNE